MLIQPTKAEGQQQLGFLESAVSEPKKTVIIVDDNHDIIEAYVFLISKKLTDFVVTQTFENGKELVDYVATKLVTSTNKDPDLIIIDNQMPQMNGTDAARILKRVKPNLKIILATALDTSELTSDDVKCFDAVVGKPFTTKDLLTTIRSVVTSTGRT